MAGHVVTNFRDQAARMQEEKDDQRFAFRFNPKALSRKQDRKQERLAKKARRSGGTVAPAPKATPKKVGPKQAPEVSAKPPVAVQKTKSKPLVLDSKLQAIKDDDAKIRRMKKILKFKKSSKPSWLEEDGLDDLLDGMDSASEDEEEEEEVDEEDDNDEEEEEDDNNDEEEEEDDNDDEDEEDGDEDQDDLDLGDVDGEEEVAETAAEKRQRDVADDEDAEAVEKPPAKTSKGAAGEKYVPPRARQLSTSADEGESLERLRRVVRGHLNKLSESNLGSITTLIQELFLKNTRHNVSSTITSVIIQACEDTSAMLDAFLAYYAALECSLSALVGSDIGASFLQEAFDKFMLHYQKTKQALVGAEDELGLGKESTNLLILLVHLYIFGLVQSQLILDLAQVFAASFSPLDVELLLVVIKHAGFRLRSDNPTGLKELILAVNHQSQASNKVSSARVKFMLETISNVKNNRKITNAADQALELKVAPLHKLVRGYFRQSQTDGLRVSLSDLQSVKERGRWWLVGAAWAGRSDGEAQQQQQLQNQKVTAEEAQLMAVAKAQGMNTEIRRKVFVALMSSQDFTEAFTNMMKLNLKDQQEREIARVLFHCCKQEQAFNRFYALVAEKLCNVKYAFKITFQFVFWDMFKEMSSLESRALSNVAHLLAFLLSSGSVYMSVFKPVQFHALSKTEASFFRLVFSLVLLSFDQEWRSTTPQLRHTMQQKHHDKVANIFRKGHDPEELREGLLFFLQHFIKPLTSSSNSLLEADQRDHLKQSIREATGALKSSSNAIDSFSM